jgi:hypothetical protein
MSTGGAGKETEASMEHTEICTGFESACDQVVQLLHNGATLSEPQQLLIKSTIEVLRLTFDNWSKLPKSERNGGPDKA